MFPLIEDIQSSKTLCNQARDHNVQFLCGTSQLVILVKPPSAPTAKMTFNANISHVIGVLSGLNAQRNNQTDLCDVELNMADGTLYSHKAVLVTCSKYFEAMFSHENMVENVEGRIDLSQFSSDVMESLLTYIYTGAIEISDETLVNRLEAAQYFQVDGVVERCCQFMAQSLSADNYADFLNETSRLSLQDTESKIKLFIENNICLDFAEKSDTQFQKLPFDCAHQLLNSDNNLPNVKSEYENLSTCHPVVARR